MNAVKELSKVSSGTDFVISICMVKIMNMELFGDTEGDDLVQCTAQILRQTFRSYDIIGRYSNDEFILALSSCSDVLAEGKLNSALKALLELTKTKHWKCEPELKYGICMSTEIKMDSDDYLEALISLAKERMEGK